MNQDIIKVPARLQAIARSKDNPHRGINLYELLVLGFIAGGFKPSKQNPTPHDLAVSWLRAAHFAAVRDFQDYLAKDRAANTGFDDETPKGSK